MPVDLWTQLNLHKLPEVAKIRKGPTIWFRLPLGILKMLVSFGKSRIQNILVTDHSKDHNS